MPYFRKTLLFYLVLTFLCVERSGFGQANGTVLAQGEGTAVEKLAIAVAAAKTDEERSGLISRETELLTPALVQALFKQGKALERGKDQAQALKVYELAGQLAERLDDKGGIVESYLNIGGLYSSQQGKQAQAMEILQKGLALGEKWDEKKSSALILASLGWINRSQGNYEEALKQFQKSLALSEVIQYRPNIYYSLLNIGILYRLQGDYAKALEYAQKTLLISESLTDKKLISDALKATGNIHIMQGNYRMGLDYFQKAEVLIKEAGDKPGLAGLLINIGVTYDRQGDYEQAQGYYAQALALYEESKNKSGEAFALNNLGTVLSNQKQSAQALEFYRRSLKLREELNEKQNVAETMHNIGKAQADLGDYVLALESFRKSLELWHGGDRVGEARVLNSIAFTYYRQGDHEQAINFAERATTILREVGSREFLWDTRLTAARAYFALKRFDKTQQALEEAIAIIEELRAQVAGNEAQQAISFEHRVAPYQLMAELLLAEGKREAALNYTELARARVLLDVIRSGRVNITKAMSPEERERERQLNGALLLLNNQLKAETSRSKPDQSRLDDLKARLQKARLQREDFQTSLYAAHPELKVRRGESEPVKLEEAGDLLTDANSALLEFMVTENRLILFVLTRGGERTGKPAGVNLSVYPIEVKSNNLAALINGFRQKLEQRALDFKPRARELFDLLLKPAAEQLKGKSSLIILPDGILWDLPFQALQSADNRYLVEDHAISYSHSLMVLREIMRSSQRQARGGGALLAFGNPLVNARSNDQGRSALLGSAPGPLPETEKQVTRLAQLYGSGRSKIYVGAEAREERAKAEAGNYRLLQFATHAILDDANPMYSYIIFSQADGQSEDGRLEAWEMMNLNLRADMVVLSACETARGRFNPGEGVVGMAWALFIAGSPTTVVSQWKVDSASTTQLMLEFHSQLQADKQQKGAHNAKAEALRQASLKLLKADEYRHPFYWAGFVVIGDAR